MHYVADYFYFLSQVMTLVIALLILLAGILLLAGKGKDRSRNRLTLKPLNQHYDEVREQLNAELMSKDEFKKYLKDHKKAVKKQAKETRKRIFVLDFDGDVRASAVASLREEVTGILLIAKPGDEVVVKLESGGGMVHSYGLAASQLERIKQQQLRLIVAIDKVAASGGYLMACVADRIIAAPFAIVGSIGVLAQIPNFNKLLKKNDIEFEQVTAGEYKRTLTVFGENTEKGREKFKQEIEDIHDHFKEFVHAHRGQIDIQKVATGEHWLASRGIEYKLVDALQTSDDYLLMASEHSDLYQINYHEKKPLLAKLLGKGLNLRALPWV